MSLSDKIREHPAMDGFEFLITHDVKEAVQELKNKIEEPYGKMVHMTKIEMKEIIDEIFGDKLTGEQNDAH